MAAGLLDVVRDVAFDHVFLLLLPGVDSGTLGSVALGCTLKTVVFFLVAPLEVLPAMMWLLLVVSGCEFPVLAVPLPMVCSLGCWQGRIWLS